MFNLLRRIFRSSSSAVRQLINDGAVIIDVRTPYEFRSGHLPGSRNIPLDTLPSRIQELKKLNKMIITVCRSGARSGTAKDMLTAAGIDAYDGGSWTSLKDGAG